MKRLFAFILATMICLGTSLTAFADDGVMLIDGYDEPMLIDDYGDMPESDEQFIPSYDDSSYDVLSYDNVDLRNVVDQAGVLEPAEAQMLNKRLMLLYSELNFDIVIVTAVGLEKDSLMAYADDYFDYNGYGYGDKHDGMLLLVNIPNDGIYERGNSWISTTGKGITYFDDDDIQDIGYDVTPYLLDGEYYYAFEKFIDDAQSGVKEGKTSAKMLVVVCGLVAGLVVALVYTGQLKRQLKSVNMAVDANNYLVEGSMNLRSEYDHYLYSNVTKTQIESKSSGSSTHTSSSGTSHGGGGF